MFHTDRSFPAKHPAYAELRLQPVRLPMQRDWQDPGSVHPVPVAADEA